MAAKNLQRMRQIKKCQLRRFDKSSDVLTKMENKRQRRLQKERDATIVDKTVQMVLERRQRANMANRG